MQSNQLQMSDKEFELFRSLIYDKVGIHLADEKRQLLVARLQEIVLRDGHGSFAKYYESELANPSRAALTEMVDRISTNHTFFNRESSHFDYLSQTVLPEVSARRNKAGSKRFRMWCAAASSGQEPYTLAMLQMKYFGIEFDRWDAGLLATDISQRVLDQARKGVYSEEEVNPLPKDLKSKYFESCDSGLRVVEQVKSQVLFRRLNLMTPKYPFRSPFDVIFCRNVMIYFDEKTKREVVRKMVDCLEPGGYLFVGKAESVGQFSDKLEYATPGGYRRCK